MSNSTPTGSLPVHRVNATSTPEITPEIMNNTNDHSPLAEGSITPHSTTSTAQQQQQQQQQQQVRRRQLRKREPATAPVYAESSHRSVSNSPSPSPSPSRLAESRSSSRSRSSSISISISGKHSMEKNKEDKSAPAKRKYTKRTARSSTDSNSNSSSNGGVSESNPQLLSPSSHFNDTQTNRIPLNYDPSIVSSNSNNNFPITADLKGAIIVNQFELRLKDGTKVRKGDNIYLVCEPPGEPYYVARVMSFVLKEGRRSTSKDDGHPVRTKKRREDIEIQDADQFMMKVNWYYRARDISKVNSDSRLLYCSMHSDTCPLDSYRGKVTVLHKDEIEAFESYKLKPNHFWFDKLYDRYMIRFYDVIPTERLSSLPSVYVKALQKRFPYIFVEVGKAKELLQSRRTCCKCTQWCSSSESVRCFECQLLYHYLCIDPPLTKKPVRGTVWVCPTCLENPEPQTRTVDQVSEDEGTLYDSLASKFLEQDRNFTFQERRDKEEWVYRYLGIHTRLQDALDLQDSPYPRAVSRLGPKNQYTGISDWLGHPVVYYDPVTLNEQFKNNGDLEDGSGGNSSCKGKKKTGKRGRNASEERVEEKEQIRQNPLKVPKEYQETNPGDFPEWLQRRPTGYIERGGDDGTTSELLWVCPKRQEKEEEEIQDVIAKYVQDQGDIAKRLQMNSYSPNFMDAVLNNLLRTNYNTVEARELNEKLTRSTLKEPTLLAEEIAKFEAGVTKYGSELYPVYQEVATQPCSMIVRFYYMWKKTANGKKIWGSYEGRKKKKTYEDPVEKSPELQKMKEEKEDDGLVSADQWKLSSSSSSLQTAHRCKHCHTAVGSKWFVAPVASLHHQQHHDQPPQSTSSSNHVTLSDQKAALCGRCARLWRRYAVVWEDPLEVMKKVTASRKRPVEAELVQDADEIVKLRECPGIEMEKTNEGKRPREDDGKGQGGEEEEEEQEQEQEQAGREDGERIKRKYVKKDPKVKEVEKNRVKRKYVRKSSLVEEGDAGDVVMETIDVDEGAEVSSCSHSTNEEQDDHDDGDYKTRSSADSQSSGRSRGSRNSTDSASISSTVAASSAASASTPSPLRKELEGQTFVNFTTRYVKRKAAADQDIKLSDVEKRELTLLAEEIKSQHAVKPEHGAVKRKDVEVSQAHGKSNRKFTVKVIHPLHEINKDEEGLLIGEVDFAKSQPPSSLSLMKSQSYYEVPPSADYNYIEVVDVDVEETKYPKFKGSNENEQENDHETKVYSCLKETSKETDNREGNKDQEEMTNDGIGTLDSNRPNQSKIIQDESTTAQIIKEGTTGSSRLNIHDPPMLASQQQQQQQQQHTEAKDQRCGCCLQNNKDKYQLDTPQNNKIIQCHRCSITVHFPCYGLNDSQFNEIQKSQTSSSSWLCDVCLNEMNPILSKNYRCVICDESHDNVMVEHDELGNWFHLLCLLNVLNDHGQDGSIKSINELKLERYLNPIKTRKVTCNSCIKEFTISDVFKGKLIPCFFNTNNEGHNVSDISSLEIRYICSEHKQNGDDDGDNTDKNLIGFTEVLNGLEIPAITGYIEYLRKSGKWGQMENNNGPSFRYGVLCSIDHNIKESPRYCLKCKRKLPFIVDNTLRSKFNLKRDSLCFECYSSIIPIATTNNKEALILKGILDRKSQPVCGGIYGFTDSNNKIINPNYTIPVSSLPPVPRTAKAVDQRIQELTVNSTYEDLDTYLGGSVDSSIIVNVAYPPPPLTSAVQAKTSPTATISGAVDAQMNHPIFFNDKNQPLDDVAMQKNTKLKETSETLKESSSSEQRMRRAAEREERQQKIQAEFERRKRTGEEFVRLPSKKRK